MLIDDWAAVTRSLTCPAATGAAMVTAMTRARHEANSERRRYMVLLPLLSGGCRTSSEACCGPWLAASVERPSSPKHRDLIDPDEGRRAEAADRTLESGVLAI